MPADMRMERMLGHFAALVHPKPQSILVVGCGAGITAGSFVTHPSTQHITICELEPLVPQHVAATYFGNENYNVIKDPRCQVVFDDARHFVFTSHDKYDIITSDPIHPWVKGSATLYTQEYYEMVKQHLNPGGVVTQWVPLYESNAEAVKSEIATFYKVFPNASIWANDDNGEGYDVILMGGTDDLKIDIDALQRRLEREDHSRVMASLSQVGWHSAIDMLSCYAGQVSDLGPWLEDAEINRDRNLHLQYSAGLGLNLEDATSIYQQILRYRQFHDEVFSGSDLQKKALKHAMGVAQ
jgi:spermidine synthase